MSEQGPYTRQYKKEFNRWTVAGPTNSDFWSLEEEPARIHEDALNAAHAAGRLSASEQGKELTDEEIDKALRVWMKTKFTPFYTEQGAARYFAHYLRDHGYLSKTAEEQPSQSSTEGLGASLSGTGPNAGSVLPSVEPLRAANVPGANLTDEQRYLHALKEIYQISDMGSEIEKHCIYALRITR